MWDINEVSKAEGMIPAEESEPDAILYLHVLVCVSRPTKQTVEEVFHPSRTLRKRLLMNA